MDRRAAPHLDDVPRRGRSARVASPEGGDSPFVARSRLMSATVSRSVAGSSCSRPSPTPAPSVTRRPKSAGLTGRHGPTSRTPSARSVTSWWSGSGEGANTAGHASPVEVRISSGSAYSLVKRNKSVASGTRSYSAPPDPASWRRPCGRRHSKARTRRSISVKTGHIPKHPVRETLPWCG